MIDLTKVVPWKFNAVSRSDMRVLFEAHGLVDAPMLNNISVHVKYYVNEQLAEIRVVGVAPELRRAIWEYVERYGNEDLKIT